MGYVDTDFHEMRKGVKLNKGAKVIDDASRRTSGSLRSTAAPSEWSRCAPTARLLVYTDSGNVEMKEAYAYQMTAGGPRAANVVRV